MTQSISHKTIIFSAFYFGVKRALDPRFRC